MAETLWYNRVLREIVPLATIPAARAGNVTKERNGSRGRTIFTQAWAAQHEDQRLKEEFIRTGNVPLNLLLRKGLLSLLTDPWLTIAKYLTGPIGYKARQVIWHKKLGYMGKGKHSLAISDGCILNGPSLIQLGAPFTVVIDAGSIKVNSSNNNVTASKCTENLRQKR